jgi:hypothetical protein
MKDVDSIRIRKVYASCPGWPSGGSKELSSQTQIYAIPCRLQLPTNKWRSAGPGRSLYLLSLTGLAALGGQYHSLSGTEFSASKGVTCLLPATQAESHAGSKVYIWNVFGTSFAETVRGCTVSLIYLYRLYSVEAIWRTLNCTVFVIELNGVSPYSKEEFNESIPVFLHVHFS